MDLSAEKSLADHSDTNTEKCKNESDIEEFVFDSTVARVTFKYHKTKKYSLFNLASLWEDVTLNNVAVFNEESMQYIPSIYYKRMSCNTVPELPGLPQSGLDMNVVISNLFYLSNEHRIVIYKPGQYKHRVWRNFQKAVRMIVQNKYNYIWYDANRIHVKAFGAFPLNENDHIGQGSVVCTWFVNIRYCTEQFNKNVQKYQSEMLKKMVCQKQTEQVFMLIVPY